MRIIRDFAINRYFLAKNAIFRFDKSSRSSNQDGRFYNGEEFIASF